MSRDTRLEEIIAISYLKLRLKQLLRLLTGVGLLRCLFLFLFLFLIFLLLIKVDRDWIVPAVGIGGLFFYHNERKDKDFLLISTDCGKSILSLEYLLLSFPFVGIALFKRCFLGSGFIVMAALLLSYMKSVHLRLPAIPVPFLCRGGLEYIRMFRMYALLYLVLLLVSSLAGLHGNIRVAKVLFLVWGLVQSMSFMSVPRRVELTMFRAPFLPPLEHCRHFHSFHRADSPVCPYLGECLVLRERMGEQRVLSVELGDAAVAVPFSDVHGRWKSHATLTLLAKQDCPLWLQYD